MKSALPPSHTSCYIDLQCLHLASTVVHFFDKGSYITNEGKHNYCYDFPLAVFISHHEFFCVYELFALRLIF